MNLIRETESKLNSSRDRFLDLTECLKGNLTKDAIHYCRSEIAKAEHNIEYYEQILKILKGE